MPNELKPNLYAVDHGFSKHYYWTPDPIVDQIQGLQDPNAQGLYNYNEAMVEHYAKRLAKMRIHVATLLWDTVTAEQFLGLELRGKR